MYMVGDCCAGRGVIGQGVRLPLPRAVLTRKEDGTLLEFGEHDLSNPYHGPDGKFTTKAGAVGPVLGPQAGPPTTSAAPGYKSPKMPPWKYSGNTGEQMVRANERVKIMEQAFPGVKFSPQPPHSMTKGTALAPIPDWPGKGEPHACYDHRNAVPQPEHAATVRDAIVKWGSVMGGRTGDGFSGYTALNPVMISTDLTYAQVFGGVRALYDRDPYGIRITVDRLGKPVYVAVRQANYADLVENDLANPYHGPDGKFTDKAGAVGPVLGPQAGPAAAAVTTVIPTSADEVLAKLQLLPGWARVKITDRSTGASFDMNNSDLVSFLKLRPADTAQYTFELPEVPTPPIRESADIAIAPYANVEEMPGVSNVATLPYAHPNEQPFVRAVFYAQGFDGLPDVVTLAELQGYAGAGEEVIYRGIGRTEPDATVNYTEQFRTGELFIGNGMSGAGTYTARNVEMAQSYAGMRGKVMMMTLRKDARVITREALSAQLSAEWNVLLDDYTRKTDALFDARDAGELTKEAFRIQRDRISTERDTRLRRLDFTDEGIYAAVHGYDAIEADWGYLVLNRTALRVLKQDNLKIDGRTIERG